MSKKIVVIVGSLSATSINRQLAVGLTRLAPADVSFDWLELGDLPLYNRDNDANPTAAVSRVKQQIEAADAVLVVTPEYNRSIPGPLKNLIDHGSRPSGKSSWIGKVGAIIGTSPGGVGTAMAQNHLRVVLSAQGVALMPGPDAYIQFKEGLIDADGNIGQASQAFLQKWVDQFLVWVQRNS